MNILVCAMLVYLNTMDNMEAIDVCTPKGQMRRTRDKLTDLFCLFSYFAIELYKRCTARQRHKRVSETAHHRRFFTHSAGQTKTVLKNKEVRREAATREVD
jgi:hypothetical protein